MGWQADSADELSAVAPCGARPEHNAGAHVAEPRVTLQVFECETVRFFHPRSLFYTAVKRETSMSPHGVYTPN